MTAATHEAPPAKVLNAPMLMTAAVSGISGGLYGYDTGIISGALLQISREFHTGNCRMAPLSLGVCAGLVVSSILVGAAFGVYSRRHGPSRLV